MKKPLVYFHPSQLPAHYDDGGFFYDTMGFGEICTESDQLVDLLCEYMENGCKMKPKYVERLKISISLTITTTVKEFTTKSSSISNRLTKIN